MQALDADQPDLPAVGDPAQRLEADRGILLVAVEAEQRGAAVLGDVDQIAAVVCVAIVLVSKLILSASAIKIYCEPVAFQLPGDPDTTVAAALYPPKASETSMRCWCSRMAPAPAIFIRSWSVTRAASPRAASRW